MSASRQSIWSSSRFATQSTLRHLAIIMDGNRRWAARRRFPARDGHRAGARMAVRIVRAAPRREIECLTLFAFASANWRRAPSEIESISSGQRMLRIALDHSSRDAIVAAASGWREGDDRTAFEQRLTGAAPPVDLLIRTSGEHRLSDFLLYECAFAELHFSSRLWPVSMKPLWPRLSPGSGAGNGVSEDEHE